MCYFLGKLQEPHYMLSKPKGMKGKDATIKLPLIAYGPMLSQSIMETSIACSLHSQQSRGCDIQQGSAPTDVAPAMLAHTILQHTVSLLQASLA